MANGNDAHGHAPATAHGHGHPPPPAHAGTGAASGGHGGHGGGHLHDAPPAMATALIALAIGSIVAGWIGIPHALGGHNGLGTWLEPAFQATNCGAPVTTGELAGFAIENCAPGTEPALASLTQTAEPAQPGAEPAEAAHEAPEGEHDETALERTLMGVSTLIAFTGIGLAFFLWQKNRHIPEQMARQFAPVHQLLLNKYYVDEVYDAAIVQPIKVASTEGLWKVIDVKVIDGVVNGAGYVVSGFAGGLRLLQTGSVQELCGRYVPGRGVHPCLLLLEIARSDRCSDALARHRPPLAGSPPAAVHRQPGRVEGRPRSATSRWRCRWSRSAVTLALWAGFDSSPTAESFQFVERQPWIPDLRHRLLPRHRRPQPDADRADRLPHPDCAAHLVGEHRDQGEGVLDLDAGAREPR